MFALSTITSSYRSRLIIGAYKKWIYKNDKVLDVGCGTGITAIQVENYFGAKVIGCDINNYLISKLPFKKMSTQNTLPFKNKEFDVVMFNDVLHHTSFENQEKLITEALRVGKRVVIFEVQPTISGKLFDYILNKIHYGNLDIPFTFRTTSDWTTLFKKLHLKQKSKKVKRPFVYPFSHVAFCLLG